MKRAKLLWQIFYNMLAVSAFTFGGGYVMVPIMVKRFSQKLGWIEEEELLELAALGQSSPGAMAVNTAVIIGRRMAGFSGSVIAALGSVLPPIVILSVVCIIYERISGNVYVAAALRGMQAGIAAVIADVVYTMARPNFKKGGALPVIIMLCAFALSYFTSLNVVFIILAAIAVGAVQWLVERRKGAAR